MHGDGVGAAGELEQGDGLGAGRADAILVGVVGENGEVEPACLARQRLPIAPKPTMPSVEPATRRVGSPVARLQSPRRTARS